MKTFSDFSFNLFCLLFGFFLGNLFPNISYNLESQKTLSVPDLNDPRIDVLIQTISGKIPGPSQVGLIILLLSEVINWAGKMFRVRQTIPNGTRGVFPFFPFINSVKIGLLFGIFVDAFKVGS